MRDIKEIENDIDKIKLELQELKVQKEPETKAEKWRPKEGERYYFVNYCGIVSWYEYDDYNTDNTMIKNIKNVFKTKEEAEEYREYIKVKKEYSTEFTTKEWENRNITKYYIYLDYANKKLYQSCNCFIKYMNATYFTEENAEKFIKKYEKQILKYEFEIEEE